MGKIFTAKPRMNIANKQININLPKSQLKFPKGKTPKEMKLEIKGIKW